MPVAPNVLVHNVGSNTVNVNVYQDSEIVSTYPLSPSAKESFTVDSSRRIEVVSSEAPTP